MSRADVLRHLYRVAAVGVPVVGTVFWVILLYVVISRNQRG